MLKFEKKIRRQKVKCTFFAIYSTLIYLPIETELTPHLEHVPEVQVIYIFSKIPTMEEEILPQKYWVLQVKFP